MRSPWLILSAFVVSSVFAENTIPPNPNQPNPQQQPVIVFPQQPQQSPPQSPFPNIPGAAYTQRLKPDSGGMKQIEKDGEKENEKNESRFEKFLKNSNSNFEKQNQQTNTIDADAVQKRLDAITSTAQTRFDSIMKSPGPSTAAQQAADATAASIIRNDALVKGQQAIRAGFNPLRRNSGNGSPSRTIGQVLQDSIAGRRTGKISQDGMIRGQKSINPVGKVPFIGGKDRQKNDAPPSDLPPDDTSSGADDVAPAPGHGNITPL